MTYALRRQGRVHPLGCTCPQHRPGLGSLGGVVPLSPQARAVLQAKLDEALRDYRAMAGDIARLISGVPFTVQSFDEALAAARRAGPTGVAQMTRQQLASLIVGTFAKVEHVLTNAAAMLATARDANVGAVVDQAITAARTAMLRMGQIRAALQAMSGLGSTTAAQVAVTVGLLLTMTGVGGAPGLLLVVGGTAYLLYQSVQELNAAEVRVDQYLRDFQSFCGQRPDRDACIAEYQRVVEVATSAQTAVMRTNAEIERERERQRSEGTWGILLRPLGEAAPYLIAGGAVLVFGTVMYFTWPLLSGFRRGSKAVASKIAQNGRRRRRR